MNRNDVLEEAARVCESRIHGKIDPKTGDWDSSHYAPYNSEDMACAAAIRALKS